jgi:hypothetical protein
LLVFEAQSLLSSDLIEIYDQDFCSLLDMRVFRSGASFRREEGSVFLFRRHVCCTKVQSSPVNCCWSSPAQWCLIPSPMGLITMYYCLTALERSDSKLGDQVLVFMCPGDRMAQLYPHTRGSLFIAFYDS